MWQKAITIHDKAPSIHDIWSKIESATSITSEHMRATTQNQVMANVPFPNKKPYFHNLYHSSTAKANIRAVEAENQKKIAELKKRE